MTDNEIRQESIAVLGILAICIIMLFGVITVGAIVSTSGNNPEIINTKTRFVNIDDSTGNILVLNVFGDTLINSNLFLKIHKMPEITKGTLTPKKR